MKFILVFNTLLQLISKTNTQRRIFMIIKKQSGLREFIDTVKDIKHIISSNDERKEKKERWKRNIRKAIRDFLDPREY